MIFHRQIGDGPIKVAAIHGWFADHRAFETMFSCLDVKRFSYAFPDIRGYGHSRHEAGDYSRRINAKSEKKGWASAKQRGQVCQVGRLAVHSFQRNAVKAQHQARKEDKEGEVCEAGRNMFYIY